MYVRDLDATGATIVTTPTMGFTIKMMPKKLVSVAVNHSVGMIRTVDHLNGHSTIVAGGSMGNVKLSLMPQ